MPRLSVLLLATTLAAGPMAGALAQATAPGAPATATPPAMPAKAPADAPPTDEARAAADHAAFFEARLAALHAGLTLTPDQERLWSPVEQAIRSFVKVRADLRDKRSDTRQDSADGDVGDDVDYITALRNYADDQAARALALKSVADAATPLYAALTDDQRHRVPLLLRQMAPHNRMAQQMGERMEEHMEGHDRHGWHREGADDMNQHRGGMYGDPGARHRWDPDRDSDED